MAKSIRDQFLKSGLVSKQQANKATQDKGKGRKQKQGKRSAAAAQATDASAAAAKAARDRKLNQEIVEKRRQTELAAQVRQLVQRHQIARDNCEIAYNFQHDTAVRSIYVNDSLRQSLISGTLAIVFVDERYELVPSPVAERIRERDASYIVDTESSDTQPDEDDPYKDFVVPDDLNW